MIVKPQEPSSISCRISLSSYCIHWIHQLSRKDLEWLGYFFSDGGTYIKDSSKKKKNSLKTRSVSPRTKPITVFLQGDNFHTENDCITVQESHSYLYDQTSHSSVQKPEHMNPIYILPSLITYPSIYQKML